MAAAKPYGPKPPLVRRPWEWRSLKVLGKRKPMWLRSRGVLKGTVVYIDPKYL